MTKRTSPRPPLRPKAAVCLLAAVLPMAVLMAASAAAPPSFAGEADAAEAFPPAVPRLAVERPPSGPGGVHSLDVFSDGARLHVLVSGSEGATGPEFLRHLLSENGGRTWNPPVTVDTGPAPMVRFGSGGSTVQVAAHGRHVVAFWTVKGESGLDGDWGPLAAARSEDGGRTWRRNPVSPAGPGAATAQYGADLAVDSRGVFHATWLDHPDNGKSVAVYAVSADYGAHWQPAVTADGDICTCCPNRIAVADGRRVEILYRDAPLRDMALARSGDGGATWTAGGPVVRFGWVFAGCPGTGGGLADTGRTLHATVWTGQEGKAGVYHAASADGGASWTAPVRLGTGTARNSDIAASDGPELAAVWDEAPPGGFAIMAARSLDGGLTWSTPQPLQVSGDVVSHPRVVAAPAGFRAFWLEHQGKETRWATAPLPETADHAPPSR